MHNKVIEYRQLRHMHDIGVLLQLVDGAQARAPSACVAELLYA